MASTCLMTLSGSLSLTLLLSRALSPSRSPALYHPFALPLSRTMTHLFTPPPASIARRRYHRWMRCSFVDLNPHAKWCPRPGCENCVENIKGGRRDIVCACGMNWCWACQNGSHAPALCTQVLRWEKKMCDESGTDNWIKTHTKQVGARPANALSSPLLVLLLLLPCSVP